MCNRVSGLTQQSDVRSEYLLTMSYTNWLRRQVQKLEAEIGRTAIFDTASPPSARELQELRSKVVIHTYLEQQLRRRETLSPVELDDEFDTREFEVVDRTYGTNRTYGTYRTYR